MLFLRILHFILEAAIQDVLSSDYTEAFEPLTGKKVSVSRAKNIVDGLLQHFLDKSERFFLDFRHECAFQIYSNVVFDQLNLLELGVWIFPIFLRVILDHF